MIQQPLISFVRFDPIELPLANRLLVKWGHKMGPINRPMKGSVESGGGDLAHALFVENDPIGVTVASTLISKNVAQRSDLTRENTVELSRVCSGRNHISRLLLRLWRETVFLALPFEHVISYQDAVIHTGDLYRFDGWRCVVNSARSGVDTRSGRPGRRKKVWLWSKGAAVTTDIRGESRGRGRR